MRLLTIFFLSLVWTSCEGQVKTVKDPTVDLREGRVTYTVTGEGTTPSWEFEVLFNPDYAVIKEKYARGASKKYIFDKEANEILGLIDDASFLGTKKDSYIIYYTPQGLVREALSSNYGDTTIIKTEEFKEILGFRCQKSIIKHGDQVTVDVWLTDKIKPGIIYPWTPLVLEELALEYEIKILGSTDRKYVVKSMFDEGIGKDEFEHNVPEPYHLVVPASVFSIDSRWAKKHEENEFQSFTYPYFGEGRESTIKYLKDKLGEIIKTDEKAKVSIEFFVDKDGKVEDVEVSINYNKSDERTEKIKKLIQGMNEWTPGNVKGKPVKSKVLIFA